MKPHIYLWRLKQCSHFMLWCLLWHRRLLDYMYRKSMKCNLRIRARLFPYYLKWDDAMFKDERGGL